MILYFPHRIRGQGKRLIPPFPPTLFFFPYPVFQGLVDGNPKICNTEVWPTSISKKQTKKLLNFTVLRIHFILIWIQIRIIIHRKSGSGSDYGNRSGSGGGCGSLFEFHFFLIFFSGKDIIL